MRRGDVVTVAVSGDFGKPGPAVIVQTDALPEGHGSVIVCQMTSQIANAPHLRIEIEPAKQNGLQVRSQVMTDKPVAIRRERIGRRIGRLSPAEMSRVNTALTFVLGLTD